jgi:hypothetical protein
MNIIRRKIHKWLIGKEIKNAISDLNHTIMALQNAKNSKEHCLYYATIKKTQHGLCYYFNCKYENKSNYIKDRLKISNGGYLFYSQNVPTLQRAMDPFSHIEWREASIDLCKQRIAYLKKFI